MDRSLVLEIVRVTEVAAIRSARWAGRGMKDEADRAATEAMRDMLSSIRMEGTVVIGEGEMDEAPMLYIGEKLGLGGPPYLDIAVDPLEGTTILANGWGNAISVIAVAPRGQLLHAPDIYMEKIAVGPAAKGKVDLTGSVADNLKAVARATGKDISEVVVAVLNRPRHQGIIEDVREAGARVMLISDGDVTAALNTAFESSEIDMLLGSGGAPEGVLAAAGLKCLGGEIQGRLVIENQEQWNRCQSMGLTNPAKVLSMDDLAAGDDIIFAATGVTNGDLLGGVRFAGNHARTHSLIMRSKTRTMRFIEATHDLSIKWAPIGQEA